MPSLLRKKGKESKVIKRFHFRIADSPPSVVGEEASYVTPRGGDRGRRSSDMLCLGDGRKVSIPSSSSSLFSAAFVPTIASAAKAVGGYSKFVLNRKDWKSLIDENRQQHAEKNERRWPWERRERHPCIFQTHWVEQPAIIADLGQVEQRPQTAATTTTTLNKTLLLESLGFPKRRCTFRDPEASFKCETTCADARLPMLVGVQTMSDHPRGANATNPKLENAGPEKKPEKKFVCPICHIWWCSMAEASEHMDACLSNSMRHSCVPQPQDSTKQEKIPNVGKTEGRKLLGISILAQEASNNTCHVIKARLKLTEAVNTFLAGAPFDATRDLLILLKNIVNAPKAERFRTVWMAKLHANRQMQGMALDGMKLLGSVGFQLFDQGVEVMGVMDEPSQEELEIIKHTITLLEPNMLVKPKSPRIPLSTSLSWPKHIDRQIRLFYALDNVKTAKVQVPDSCFEVSGEELDRADMMRQNHQGQWRIEMNPNSHKEKHCRKQYWAAIIRILFPDRTILQGLFLPSEPTTSLYQFVASALRDSTTPFKLLLPRVIGTGWNSTRTGVVPSGPNPDGRLVTLEQVNLVPTALLKFQAVQTIQPPTIRADYLAMRESLNVPMSLPITPRTC
ncbi:unnamed protein product [Sphagnum troendelagicum]